MKYRWNKLYAKINSLNDGRNGPKRTEFIIAGIIMLVALFSFCFMKDFSLTIRQSLLFNSSLFNGKVFRFYSVINDHAVAGFFEGWPASLLSGANYSIINYATYGLVCMPLYLIDKVFKLSLSLVWYEVIIKIFYAVITVGMVWTIKRICELLHFDNVKKKWTIFMFMTSSVFIFSSLMINHLDIFSLFFMLLAIKEVIAKNRKKELLYFMLAVFYKPFVLIGIIPMILLREKRIFHIAKDIIIICSGIIFQNVVYHFDSGYALVKSYMNSAYSFLDKFLISGYGMQRNNYLGTVSFFVVTYVLICVAAYCLKNKKEKYYLFALPFLSWCSFILFVQWHPNWLLLIAPSMIFMTVYTDKIKVFGIIECVFNTFAILVTAIGWEHNYNESMIDGGILSQILGLTSNPDASVWKFLRYKVSIPIDIYGSLLSASLICMALLVVYEIWRRKYHPVKEPVIVYERSIMWLRIVPLLLFIGYSFITLFL